MRRFNIEQTRILQKIQQLEYYIKEFSELLPVSEEIYFNSLEKRRAIERQLHIMIECVLEISFLLIRYLNLGIPSNEENLFDLLKKDLRNINRLKEMKGFRNILVHRYGDVNDSKVLEFALNDQQDFDIFLEDVRNILARSINRNK